MLSPPQNPGPKPKKEPVLLSTLPSSCPDHTPRLLCEMTQKQTLSHSALHDDESLRGAVTSLSSLLPPTWRKENGQDGS